MKKRTGKSYALIISALLSVLFFFAATILAGMSFVDRRVRDIYGKESYTDSVVDFLIDSKTEDLSQKVFKAYLNGNKKLSVSVPSEYREDRSNFFFKATDSDGRLFLQNYYTDSFSYHTTKIVTVQFSANKDSLYETDTITVECYLKSDLTAKDAFYRADRMMRFFKSIAIAHILMTVFIFLSLWCAGCCLRFFWHMGKKKNRNMPLSYVSADMFFAAVLPLMVFCMGKIRDILDARDEILRDYILSGVGQNHFFISSIYQTILYMLIFSVLILVFYDIAFGGPSYLVSFARYKKYPFTHKSVVYLVAIQIIKSVAIGIYFTSYTHLIIMMLLFEKLITLPVLFKSMREMRSIMDKTESYVGGDISSSIDTSGYFRTFKDHAADIRSITDRISVSADEYIRSCKFKAELITNLSHDIKTPLTSILSYAQLLKKDNLSKEERDQFLSVLGRHSLRLSKLIEDLADVSDATSGKISVNPVMIDLCDIIPQVVIGFEERLQKKGIKVKLSLPEKQVVLADTRLLWRVLDNLMNNICKYAKENTKAEISIMQKGDNVIIGVGNISSYVIEVSGEALAERFMRADASRHTDGSGLGLSIAKSLMELMNGTLKIETDKDRFFAYVVFFGR